MRSSMGAPADCATSNATVATYRSVPGVNPAALEATSPLDHREDWNRFTQPHRERDRLVDLSERARRAEQCGFECVAAIDRLVIRASALSWPSRWRPEMRRAVFGLTPQLCEIAQRDGRPDLGPRSHCARMTSGYRDRDGIVPEHPLQRGHVGASRTGSDAQMCVESYWGSHRTAASPLLSGLELKASGVRGAPRRTASITCSNSGTRLVVTRTPAPITMQS